MMKRISNAVLRFSDVLAFIGALGAALFLAAIPIFVVSEIIARAIFKQSIGVSWEYSTYLMALVFLLGAAYTLRTGGHIRVTALPIKPNTRASFLIEFLSSTVGSALCIFLAVSLSDLAWQAFSRGVTSATPEQTPLFVPMTGVATGAWILALQMTARVLAVASGHETEKSAPDTNELEPTGQTQ